MDISLPVPQILQNPELPNGCEITSLCEVLHFLGYVVDKCTLADHYLPQSEKWFGADPDRVYLGNPRLDDCSPETGYYCFTGPLIQAAEHYLEDAGAADRYFLLDLSGSDQAGLEAQLLAGNPFIFWASLHFNDIQFDPCGGWTLPDGRYHRVFHQLHCMVCCGMDDEYFYIADPLDFNTRVEKARFMKIYRELGSRALVIQPKADL